VRPIFPSSLERVAQPTVVMQLETILGERGPGDIATEPLETWSVATVNHDLRVHVYAADFGERLGRRCLA